MDDPTPTPGGDGARYRHHRWRVEPLTAITLDEPLVAWVDAELPPDVNHIGSGGLAEDLPALVYPVVERGEELLLVGLFDSFAALREAGGQWATVHVLEAGAEREIRELAMVLATGGLS